MEFQYLPYDLPVNTSSEVESLIHVHFLSIPALLHFDLTQSSAEDNYLTFEISVHLDFDTKLSRTNDDGDVNYPIPIFLNVFLRSPFTNVTRRSANDSSIPMPFVLVIRPPRHEDHLRQRLYNCRGHPLLLCKVLLFIIIIVSLVIC
uniref:Uncharacterized protein n=1 Tax=Glossina brevipalpis TaxID=37001 RepID=A0A1A9W875_9MUSC